MMKRTRLSQLGIGALLITAVTGSLAVTGCSHNAPAATPAQIKADMGGQYSPDALAQAKAYQAKQDQMRAGDDPIPRRRRGSRNPGPGRKPLENHEALEDNASSSSMPAC